MSIWKFDPPKLKWRCQFQSWKRQREDNLLHFAFSDVGTFEIYEGSSRTNFLLSFPKQLRMPAELFHDLQSAKIHAEVALRNSHALTKERTNVQ